MTKEEINKLLELPARYDEWNDESIISNTIRNKPCEICGDLQTKTHYNLHLVRCKKIKEITPDVLATYETLKLPTIAKIASILKVDARYVSEIFDKHNLISYRLEDVEDKILELYYQRLSNDQIGEKIGCTGTSICIFLKDRGLKPWYSSPGEIGINAQEKIDLIKPLFEKGLTSSQISKETGLEPATIRRIVGKYFEGSFDSSHIENGKLQEEKVLKMYHNGEKLSSADISRKTGIAPRTVARYLKKNGLKAWGRRKK